MIKCFNYFLLLTLTLAFSLNAAHAEICEKKLMQEINKLITKDKDGVLALQFELTSLKMAAYARKNNRKTLEGLANKKRRILLKNKNIEADLNELYKNFGVNEDYNEIRTFLSKNNLKTKNTFVFRNKDKRLNGNLSSSLLEALRISSPESNIKESDVAITWLANKVALSSSGSGLNESVAEINGFLTNRKPLTSKELTERETEISSAIHKNFEDLKTRFINKFSECSNRPLFGNCLTVDLIKKQFFMYLNEDVVNVLNNPVITTSIREEATQAITAEVSTMAPILIEEVIAQSNSKSCGMPGHEPCPTFNEAPPSTNNSSISRMSGAANINLNTIVHLENGGFQLSPAGFKRAFTEAEIKALEDSGFKVEKTLSRTPIYILTPNSNQTTQAHSKSCGMPGNEPCPTFNEAPPSTNNSSISRVSGAANINLNTIVPLENGGFQLSPAGFKRAFTEAEIKALEDSGFKVEKTLSRTPIYILTPNSNQTTQAHSKSCGMPGNEPCPTFNEAPPSTNNSSISRVSGAANINLNTIVPLENGGFQLSPAGFKRAFTEAEIKALEDSGFKVEKTLSRTPIYILTPNSNQTTQAHSKSCGMPGNEPCPTFNEAPPSTNNSSISRMSGAANINLNTIVPLENGGFQLSPAGFKRAFTEAEIKALEDSGFKVEKTLSRTPIYILTPN